MRSTKSLSIGLCAWNEAARLGDTLASLGEQDCFHEAGEDFGQLEIIVVANACTDETEAVAQQALATLKESSARELFVRVVSTTVKGKANAWNMFVHECSSRSADYLVLLDCDIRFLGRNVISQLASLLNDNPVVSVARPVCLKSTELEGKRSLADALGLWMTKQKRQQQRHVGLPGAIYCARAAALRTVWQPLGMIGEDGHVRDMIVTENWRCPKARRDEKIALASDVAIAFEAHSTLGSILTHQVRSRIGLANRAILHRFLDRVVGDEDAAQLTARLNAEDPEWYAKMIHAGLGRGWWVMPWPFLSLNRLRALGQRPVAGMLKALPAAIVGDLSDLIADIRANRHFCRRSALRVWK